MCVCQMMILNLAGVQTKPFKVSSHYFSSDISKFAKITKPLMKHQIKGKVVNK